jgi:hypothetical protein
VLAYTFLRCISFLCPLPAKTFPPKPSCQNLPAKTCRCCTFIMHATCTRALLVLLFCAELCIDFRLLRPLRPAPSNHFLILMLSQAKSAVKELWKGTLHVRW